MFAHWSLDKFALLCSQACDVFLSLSLSLSCSLCDACEHAKVFVRALSLEDEGVHRGRGCQSAFLIDSASLDNKLICDDLGTAGGNRQHRQLELRIEHALSVGCEDARHDMSAAGPLTCWFRLRWELAPTSGFRLLRARRQPDYRRGRASSRIQQIAANLSKRSRETDSNLSQTGRPRFSSKTPAVKNREAAFGKRTALNVTDFVNEKPKEWDDLNIKRKRCLCKIRLKYDNSNFMVCSTICSKST